MSQQFDQLKISSPDRPPPIGEPRGHHEAVVHEVSVDAVQRRVLRDVHLDEGAVVEEEARGHVGHVTATLHPLQQVVQLATTLVEFQAGSVLMRWNRLFVIMLEFQLIPPKNIVRISKSFRSLRLVFLCEVLALFVAELSVVTTGCGRSGRGAVLALIELVRQRHLREGTSRETGIQFIVENREEPALIYRTPVRFVLTLSPRMLVSASLCSKFRCSVIMCDSVYISSSSEDISLAVDMNCP